MSLAAVILGGGLGALLRYLVQEWARTKAGSLSLGTLLVNLSGAFLIGFLMMAFHDAFEAHPHRRLFIIAGILGGFTTFSGLGWDAYQLFTQNPASAAWYVFISFVGGAAAILLGLSLGRLL